MQTYLGQYDIEVDFIDEDDGVTENKKLPSKDEEESEKKILDTKNLPPGDREIQSEENNIDDWGSDDEDGDRMFENEQVLIMDRNRVSEGDDGSTKIVAPGQGMNAIPLHKFPDLDELFSFNLPQPITTYPKITYSNRARR